MRTFMTILSIVLGIIAPLQFLVTIWIIAFLAASRDMEPVFWTSFSTMIILGTGSAFAGSNRDAFSN